MGRWQICAGLRTGLRTDQRWKAGLLRGHLSRPAGLGTPQRCPCVHTFDYAVPACWHAKDCSDIDSFHHLQAGSGPLDRYLRLKAMQRESYMHFFYEVRTCCAVRVKWSVHSGTDASL